MQLDKSPLNTHKARSNHRTFFKMDFKDQSRAKPVPLNITQVALQSRGHKGAIRPTHHHVILAGLLNILFEVAGTR